MATCTELYIDTLVGLDLDGSTDKNLPYFVVENVATLLPPCEELDPAAISTQTPLGELIAPPGTLAI